MQNIKKDTILTLAGISASHLTELLRRFDLWLETLPPGAAIPGTYWGEPEAGLIGSCVYARADTPIHSILHEACHLIVKAPHERAAIHTNASDSIEEENAVCYLQILLADEIPGVGRDRVMRDMDAWGYTYRLGSTRAWFEHDAEDARLWLERAGLVPKLHSSHL